MTRALLLALLGIGALGCATEAAFACAGDDECAGGAGRGQCEGNGYCSFPDAACPSGRRFGDLAGGGFGGRCVDDGATDGSSTSGTSAASATTVTSDDPTTSTSSSSNTTSTSTTGPPDPVPGEPWWDCEWGARVQITVTGIPDAELTGPFDDVVVLVALGDGRIDYAMTGADGADLRFVAEDGETELAYEIEQWDPSGASFVWVRVPQVVQGTRFTLYYGGPDTPASFVPSDVWPDHYKVVWHMTDGGEDATANDNDGQGAYALVPGHVARGLTTNDDNVDDQLTLLGNASIENVFAAGGIVSTWVRFESFEIGNGSRDIVRKNLGSGGWQLEIIDDDTPLRFSRSYTDGLRGFSISAFPGHAWAHVAVYYDDSAGPSGAAVFVVDGEVVPVGESGSPTGSSEDDAGSDLEAGDELYGAFDELRLRTGGSVEEAIVDYRSQADDLLGFGPRDASGCDAPSG